MEQSRLLFTYINWRGETHQYLVHPMTIAYERAQHEGREKDPTDAWVLRAQVIQRDDEDRPGVRSFVMTKITDLKEVPRA